MQNTISYYNLSEFINRAYRANTEYFRERKQLWADFTSKLTYDSEIAIPLDTLIQLKTSLVTRNQRFDDNKSLSLNTILITLDNLLQKQEKQEKPKTKISKQEQEH